ncbi:MAG: glycosyltransferase [Steroidobacteraceae bacterium]
MRVLHVHERARYQGGVEQILHDLASGLAARGWPQALLCLDGPADPGYCAPFARVFGRADAREFDPHVVVLHKWSDPAAVQPLLDRYPAVQVVHDHDLYCPRRHKYFPIGQQACDERAGAACVSHLCLLERRGGAWPIGITSLGDFHRRAAMARRARLFVAGSRYTASELVRNGYAADRIETIAPVPAAIDAAPVHPPGEPGRMLFVGQVVRGKGLDLLLSAAAGLEVGWQLDVAGAGRQLDESRRLADQLGVADRVHFAGWVPNDELDDWYRRASFTVVPSRWPEPFGMIGLESMARGRPVVAFDSGGIGDWLAHQVSGLLVPRGDVAALARALQQLLSAPRLVRALGDQAARHSRRRYSHRAYLDAMQSALERAVGSEALRRATA